jgi:hypothetical protein
MDTGYVGDAVSASRSGDEYCDTSWLPLASPSIYRGGSTLFFTQAKKNFPVTSTCQKTPSDNIFEEQYPIRITFNNTYS